MPEFSGDPEIDLGACCACRQTKPDVRNIIALHQLAPMLGTGWGCFQCGLPMNGAIAVICDDCFDSHAPIVDVCYDLPGKKLRWSRSALSNDEFHHNMNLHPEVKLNVRFN